MGRIKILAPVLLLLLAFALPASAGGVKIGSVDMTKALSRSDAGVKATESIMAEAKKLEKELNAEQSSIKELKKEIEKKRHVWKKNTLIAKEKAFNARAAAFQKKVTRYDNNLNKKRLEKKDELVKEIRSVIKELAKKHGYTYVLDTSGGSVLYAPDNADITDDVIKAFNIRNRAAVK